MGHYVLLQIAFWHHNFCIGIIHLYVVNEEKCIRLSFFQYRQKGMEVRNSVHWQGLKVSQQTCIELMVLRIRQLIAHKLKPQSASLFCIHSVCYIKRQIKNGLREELSKTA